MGQKKESRVTPMFNGQVKTENYSVMKNKNDVFIQIWADSISQFFKKTLTSEIDTLCHFLCEY